VKRPWMSSTVKRRGEGWRATSFDHAGPVVSVWHEDRLLAIRGAAKHLEQQATPKEAGE
jgi:hypothetical protein